MAGLAIARADLAEDYTKEIRPLMSKKCFECHNAEKLKGDVNLERFKPSTPSRPNRNYGRRCCRKFRLTKCRPRRRVN
jgi:nitrate/TMAO reductase-like tetraheme cytochrome c subunit